jgi:hypothetical protein
MTVKFPAGRTRFTTDETMRLLEIPAGSKVSFYYLTNAAKVDVTERIGRARTYGRSEVERLAAELTRQRAAGTMAPPKEPPSPTSPLPDAAPAAPRGPGRPRKAATPTA